MIDYYSQEYDYEGEHPVTTLWILFEDEHWRLPGAVDEAAHPF